MPRTMAAYSPCLRCVCMTAAMSTKVYIFWVGAIFEFSGMPPAGCSCGDELRR